MNKIAGKKRKKGKSPEEKNDFSKSVEARKYKTHVEMVSHAV